MADQNPVQIFISYARRDDFGTGRLNSKGFVSALHQALERIQIQQGYPSPYLWRDTQQIEKGDYFNPKIEAAITNSQLLVVVLSRNWIERPNCLKELELFRHRWGDVRERIVVVRRHMVEEQQCPELLRGTEGYRFFRFDGPNHEAGLETYIEAEGATEAEFDAEAKALGSYLWRAAKRRRVVDGAAPLPPQGRTVYLAKPAPDMTKPYEFLATNLEMQGFKVVPSRNQIIPLDSSARHFVDSALEAADTSIHLLGDEAGYMPSDEHDPIVKMQLTRASARAADHAATKGALPFKRIIWAPKVIHDGTGFRDPLAVVEKFGTLITGDKLLSDGQSGFWTSLKQLLDDSKTLPGTDEPKQPAAAPDARIYIHHKKEDRDFAVGIASILKEKDVNIVLPPMQGTDVERERWHKEELRDCDTVLLCWAQATDVWVKTSLNELRNWQHLRRSNKFRTRGLLLGPPPGESKAPVALPPKSDYDCLLDFSNQEHPNPDSLGALLAGAPPTGQ